MTPRRAHATTEALVVPDEQSWMVWGYDLGSLGFCPVTASAQAGVLVLPSEVPVALIQPLRGLVRGLPGLARVVSLPSPMSGVKSAHALDTSSEESDTDDKPGETESDDECAHRGESDDGDAEAGAQEMDAGGGDMHCHAAQSDGEHGDEPWDSNMMPIYGPPSRDGLVMEDLDVQVGPLASGLPGGLTLAVRLDGDVVASCEVHATLVAPPNGAEAPDLLAPVAWQAAFASHSGTVNVGDATRWRGVAGVEIERALSHCAWLRAFGRLLGWHQLVDVAGDAVSAILAARSAFQIDRVAPLDALHRAERQTERLWRLLDGSRRLRGRARGRGVLTQRLITENNISGPTARATGLSVDARADDPRYEALGFTVACAAAGDVEARTVLRAQEATVALRLAAGALERVNSQCPQPRFPAVEGPRGVVYVDQASRPRAPGAEALLTLAGESVVGDEWAAAMTGVASFDLSPWRVSP